MKKIIYKFGFDNIFDFHFMSDFTTVASLIEDGTDISNLDYEDEDDFYCYSENKTYSELDLFKKFNIQKIE